jgi:uncharacterized protein
LPSIAIPPESSQPGTDWRAAGLRYHRLNFFYQKKFGCRVRKVSLDGGFDCPNRDGTLGAGGCIFCDPESFSPSLRLKIASVADQLKAGIIRLSARHRLDKFVAYFQPATNTYAPLPRLKSLLEEVLGYPQVVGLAIGTRPDCLGDAVLDLLADFARRTWLVIELGLQTIHDRTLDRLNRGHHYDSFLDAVDRCHKRNLEIGAHVILGLPGESRDDMLATARELARLGINSVKLHNLYAVKNTPLAAMVERGEVTLPELPEYAGWVVDFLEQLPAGCVVDRIGGDAPPQYLVGPSWCLHKPALLATVEAEFQRRDTWQGRKRDWGLGIGD